MVVVWHLDTGSVKTFYLPSLLIVAQGAKAVTVGQEVYQFNGARMLMLPVALPVALQGFFSANGKILSKNSRIISDPASG